MRQSALRRGVLPIALLLPLPCAPGCARTPAPRPRPAVVRTLDLTADLAAGIVVAGAIDPGRAACAPLLGSGWLPPETAADGMTYAWTAADTAELVLPLRTGGPGSFVVRACALDDSRGPRHLTAVVNNHVLGTRAVPAELGTIPFRVPAGVFLPGDNAVRLIVDRLVRPADAFGSPDMRHLGALVDLVRFVPYGASDSETAPDPYAVAASRLDSARTIELNPARLAGATLSLAWNGAAAAGDSVVVEITPARDVPAMLRLAWAAGPGEGEATATLPPNIPAKALLRMELAGWKGRAASGQVTIARAALSREVRPLNIVLIVVDTLRPDHLGCYGDERGLSPAIDLLARDGLVFTNAFATAPITGPSHASLFTSRWACETKVVNNSTGSPDPQLPMLAEILSGMDFATAAAVSIGPVSRECGFARGFGAYADDLGWGFLATGDTVTTRALWDLAHLPPPFFLWAHYSEPHEPYDAHGFVTKEAELLVDDEVRLRVPTTTYTPTALELDLPPRPVKLGLRAKDPFRVLHLAVDGLDGPSPDLLPPDPPKQEVGEFNATLGACGARRVRLTFGLRDRIKSPDALLIRYGREVAAADSAVGRLLDDLRRRSLYEDALVVFAADHGESLGEHNLVGHVENLTDVLLRVPLIVKPPRDAGLRPGRRRDLVSLVDILPTVLAQLGRPPLAGARGRDLLEPAARRRGDDAVFAETHRPQALHTLYALRGTRYKIVLDPAGPTWQFYDLKRDPREIHDRFAAGDRAARAWQTRLAAQMLELGQRTVGEDPPAAPDAKKRRELRALGY